MKKQKHDEFYTTRALVECIVEAIKDKLQGKSVFLPCDSEFSNFYIVLKEKFKELGLSSLEAFDVQGNYIRYDGIKEDKEKKDVGGFESEFAAAIFNRCDFILTNPPFSKFTNFIGILLNLQKPFFTLAALASIATSFLHDMVIAGELFTEVKTTDFITPYADELKHVNISFIAPFPFEVFKDRKLDEAPEFKRYDNCDALECSKIAHLSFIPLEYMGFVGIPCTGLTQKNISYIRTLGFEFVVLRDFEKYNLTKDPTVEGRRTFRRVYISRSLSDEKS